MTSKIIAILTLLGLVYGGLTWVDGRYAKCQETKAEIKVTKDSVKEVKRSVDILSTGITRDAKQSRLWALEDRYKTSDPTKIPDTDKKQEMRQLQIDLPKLQDKLRALEAPQ